MAEEFVKPKPPARTMSLHELRNAVKAVDKFAAARTSDEEGVKLICENYGTDTSSAQVFIEWLKGNPSGDTPATMPKVSGIERLRKGCDPDTGRETYLDPDEKPTTGKGKKK